MLRRYLVVAMLCAFMMLFSTGVVLAAEQSTTDANTQQLVVEKININSADQETLTRLPGIGEKTAEKIDTYRKEHGPFHSVDELINVKGIGPKVLEKIKPLATVG